MGCNNYVSYSLCSLSTVVIILEYMNFNKMVVLFLYVALMPFCQDVGFIM